MRLANKRAGPRQQRAAAHHHERHAVLGDEAERQLAVEMFSDDQVVRVDRAIDQLPDGRQAERGLRVLGQVVQGHGVGQHAEQPERAQPVRRVHERHVVVVQRHRALHADVPDARVSRVVVADDVYVVAAVCQSP